MINEKLKKYLLNKDEKTISLFCANGSDAGKADAIKIIDKSNAQFLDDYNNFKKQGLSENDIEKIFDKKIKVVSDTIKNHGIITGEVNKFEKNLDFYKNNFPIVKYGIDYYAKDFSVKNQEKIIEISNKLNQNLVGPEIKEIMADNKNFKERVPKKAVELIRQFEKNPSLAATFWNDTYNHYRYFNNKIYYIEVRSDALLPSIYFIEYDIENFCKGVNELCKTNSALLEKYKKNTNLYQKLLVMLVFVFAALFILFK